MLVTMIVIAMMTPSLLDKILSVHESSSDISSIESEIFDTEIQISSLSGSPGGSVINFTLSNVGEQKLWNFENFDLFVTYEADVAGTRTMTVERLTYNATGSFLNQDSADELQAGYWVLNNVTDDNVEKRILNTNEASYVLAKLLNPVYSNGKIMVVVSTETGVLSSSAIQLS
jgi:hypothetical protein